ncbi:GyrI-like domain-containing protein [Isobaculum melis]|uniref:GyrI-like small molecule binding domain-containing protein n=1 Tax=Isobaculum melis TaxID=142588 RepID=A0A1H9PS07_9LACT|nr:GyrI-like domain-containing protein [Isobaculum melis]SER50972.1 hypothetical protein SAMN04488559_10199 [Isobaculum melis]
MKHEWRKAEKETYLPKAKPTLIEVPTYSYYTLTGEGNPNDEDFGEAVAALYAMSYGIKMMPKKGITPDGYFDYTVYPLEGLWTLKEEAFSDFKEGDGFNLDDLTYKIMIRQPDFVTEALALENIKAVSAKKPNINNERVQFERITDGSSIQMLHKGAYSEEEATFAIMDAYCKEQGLQRNSPYHREIYLSDPRKTVPEKQKTVLRYQVKAID